MKELETKQRLTIIIILLAALIVIIYLIQFWYADTRFALAEKLNEASYFDQGYNEIQIANKLHPGEPYYYNELALSLAGLAVLAHKTDDASLSAQLADSAITASDEAIKISPFHLNFWKNRARIFVFLSDIDPKYQQNALETLRQTVELAPTDAKVAYNLGILYARLKQINTAIETLEHTIELKPNYADARYTLALLYQKQGKIKEAREQLKYILEKINPADTRAKNKLKEL